MATIIACVLLVLTLATTTTTTSSTTSTSATSHALEKDCLGGEGSISMQINIYSASCPQAEGIVFSIVQQAVTADSRMAASLLRLHFHDCFANGCDASVLLDDDPTVGGEKTAAPNANSLRGFEVIDEIKSALEDQCPETVSCADILAMAARDSVVISGGPTWQVEMGRRDSLIAINQTANTNIPGPNSSVATLINRFQNVGLSAKDMVALSGAHTIGKARCTTFSSRLGGGGGGGDMEFIQSLQQLCSDPNVVAHLDLSTPATFDNQYYINLLSGEGLLQSDQVLIAGGDGGVAGLVEKYATNSMMFFEDFKESMLRMGRLSPTVGSGGEVRRSCRVVNTS